MELEGVSDKPDQIDGLDFREVLQDEFRKRSEKNSRYTMGAFSQFLGLAPSRLHDILNGRNGLSRAAAEAIADRLKFSPAKRDLFCDLVESKHGRSEVKRRLAALRLADYHCQSKFKKLSLDAFRAASDWYHFAILELTYLGEFQSCVSWISEHLGIEEEVVEQGIQRLFRLGLLEDHKGVWKATEDFSSVGEDIPSSAIKKYHMQLMEKAQKALFDQSLEFREFQSMTLSLSQKKLPEAKKLLGQFQKKFAEQLREDDPPDSVYCLSMQFFSLRGGIL